MNPAASPARRLGYRLLGGGFDYLLHLRPAEWPIMTAHTALGWILAVGVHGALAGVKLEALLLGLLVWVLFLNGGTLAINSAFDQDEGDIGYLKAPPPVPRHLLVVSLVLLFGGLALSFLLPVGFRIAYAICLVMSLIYSVPPFRLKAVAGPDWLINMWGFGTLTPYAGYAVTGLPVTNSHWLVLLAFCPLFASLYPLTQLYQFEEDQRRGDRTLALILGMRRSLEIAIAAAVIAFGLFAAGALVAGWGTAGRDVLRWCGLALALSAWGWVLLPWLVRHPTMTPDEHQAGMYRGLGAWALTDVVVILAFAWYT